MPIISSSGVTGTHSEAVVKGPGVVTGRYGTLGQVYYVTEDFWPLNTTLYVRKFRGNDPKFVSYFLRSLDFSAYSDKAAVPGLNRNHLHKADIRYPADPREQSAIASALGALDDKIELNRRMNETLEAMARALFKDWFVDFGPTRAKQEGRARQDGERSGQPTTPLNLASDLPWPGAEAGAVAQGEPYLAPELWSLFPERLDAEGKPEGWEDSMLGDVSTSENRIVRPTDAPEDMPYIGLEHMPRGSIALSNWEGAGKVTSNKSAFSAGEFLFGKLRPYFHKVGIAPIDGICSTDIVVVKPKENAWSAFVLACISSREFVAYTDKTSTGTKMPRTSWKIMSRYGICRPSGAVAGAFDNMVSSALERIIRNIHESRTLAQTRDLLLPKLMSGEIRVRDAEPMVEAAL